MMSVSGSPSGVTAWNRMSNVVTPSETVFSSAFSRGLGDCSSLFYHTLGRGKAYDTRMPFSPYCHFERKREIFFVCGQAKDVRIAASGKHRAPSESEGRCFMQTALRKKTETGNEKDPSAALGMTKRGNASFHSFSTCCGSQPRLAAVGSPFQGKGLAWTLPPSYGRRCPEGAEVGWGKRYPRHKAFPAWGRWRAERAG